MPDGIGTTTLEPQMDGLIFACGHTINGSPHSLAHVIRPPSLLSLSVGGCQESSDDKLPTVADKHRALGGIGIV